MRKRRYQCLIFDADHTLLNYIADELSAFQRVYAQIGMPVGETLMQDSRRFSEETWTEAGLYNVHEPRIQQLYHKLYRSHVTGIFEKIFSKNGNPTSVTAEEAGKLFLSALKAEGEPLGKSKEVIEKLSKEYTLCIATNGLGEIQRARLQAFAPYARVYISEELDCIKPLPNFFKKILRAEKVKKRRCLMIGDSLRSDVAGANASGIDACWFNPRGQENTEKIFTRYEINDLQQLYDILEK